ncbi:hypothetical protein IMSAGC011_02732 [Lachnospiraceae bacterium]|nr:hypothetical protein IMSAGC011_02732 [Lachnospiraceae bacterium]
MPIPNLYWSVYKNLEKEFLKLSDYIYFSDDQLGTYSVFIADLIVRCSVEIEALSKELYGMLGGNMLPVDPQGNARYLYFDTDCLALLEQKWVLSKKQIVVSAANFYFADEKNRILTPLHKAHKRGTSGSKWKQAYQDVKHDRRNKLKKASIENLLHALGALYILNLYYGNEKIDIGRVYLNDLNFDNRVGSEIFSAHYCQATELKMKLNMNDSCINSPLENELEKSIYVIKYDDASFREIYKNYCLDNKITNERFSKSTEISKFLTENPEYAGKSINEICLAAGGKELLDYVVCMQHTMQDKGTRLEAILNKHMGIYPELLPIEDAITKCQTTFYLRHKP